MPIPDFIVRLRRKIGHDLLWLPAVTAVVVDDDGRVLLVERSDNGAWAPVTGIIDPGEEPAIAAVREVREETMVVAAVERLAAVRATPPMQHVNGDHAQYLDLTFRCRYLDGIARVGDDESRAVGWFAIEDLPPMAAELRRRIADAAACGSDVAFER